MRHIFGNLIFCQIFLALNGHELAEIFIRLNGVKCFVYYFDCCDKCFGQLSKLNLNGRHMTSVTRFKPTTNLKEMNGFVNTVFVERR